MRENNFTSNTRALIYCSYSGFFAFQPWNHRVAVKIATLWQFSRDFPIPIQEDRTRKWELKVRGMTRKCVTGLPVTGFWRLTNCEGKTLVKMLWYFWGISSRSGYIKKYCASEKLFGRITCSSCFSKKTFC